MLAVLGTGTRTFNAVLGSANQILQKTFAMELVEMQAMPSDQDMSEKDADLLKNTGVKKKGGFCAVECWASPTAWICGHLSFGSSVGREFLL